MKWIYFIILILSSCSQFEKNLYTDDLSYDLTFNIRGVRSSAERYAISQSSSNNSFYYMGNVGEGIDAAINIEEHSNTRTEKIASNIENLDRTTLENGIKYRIILCKTNGNCYAINGTSGGETKFLGADPGVTYKWYAYSYNTANSLDNLNVEADTINIRNSQNIYNLEGNNVEVNPKNDFLYASGEITTDPDKTVSNNIAVLFERKTANLEIILDARGMFGEILEVKNTLLNKNFKKGTFNIKNGSYVSNSFLSTSFGIINNDYKQYDSSFKDMVKKANIYIVNTNENIDGLKITLKDLKISGDRRILDGYINNWGDPHVFSNVDINVPNLSPQHGKRYKVKVTLIMTGKTIGDVTWARGNLYRKSSEEESSSIAYRMRVHAGSNVYGTVENSKGIKSSGEYFSMSANIPVNDPCKKVYPQGYWRLPTLSDFNGLKQISPSKVTFSGNEFPNPFILNGTSNSYVKEIRLFKFFLNGSEGPTDPPYDTQENRLTFMLFGYVKNGSDSEASWNLTDYSTGESAKGYYWTSDKPSNNKTYAYVLSQDGTVNNRPKSKMEAVELNDSNKANIKCVRNLSWDGTSARDL